MATAARTTRIAHRPHMISETEVWNALREVVDPEVGINVVDLGLVYAVTAERGRVHVTLTMTTPACPLAGYISEVAADAIRRHDATLADVEVAIVWDPPWTPALMSDDAKRRLGWPHE